jgi:hypothetical protein
MQDREQFSGKYEFPFQYSVGMYFLWGIQIYQVTWDLDVNI